MYTMDQAFPLKCNKIQRKSETLVNPKIYMKLLLRFHNLWLYFVVPSHPPTLKLQIPLRQGLSFIPLITLQNPKHKKHTNLYFSWFHSLARDQADTAYSLLCLRKNKRIARISKALWKVFDGSHRKDFFFKRQTKKRDRSATWHC